VVGFARSETIEAVHGPRQPWFRDAESTDIFEGAGQLQHTRIAQGPTGLDCK
jgi:hypothetical protein